MNRLLNEIKTCIPRRIDGFSYIKTQDLNTPSWEIGLECLIQSISEINLFFEIVLKFIDSGVTDIYDIANYLGVSFDIAKEVVVDMVTNNYISISASNLSMMQKGKEALKTKKLVKLLRKNINHISVDLVTGDIRDGTDMQYVQVNKASVCLDGQINVDTAFFDSHFAEFNSVFQLQQINDSVFGVEAITKELYKVVCESYHRLVYTKKEVEIYQNSDTKELKLVIESDQHNHYLNCLYNQLKLGTHPCLEYFFEKSRGFIRQSNVPCQYDEKRQMATERFIAVLLEKDAVQDVDLSLMETNRYTICEKEWRLFFPFYNEFNFERLVISTNRLRSIFPPALFYEIKNIAKNKPVTLLYNPQEYNVSSTIDYFFADKPKNLSLVPCEHINNSKILFFPYVLIDIQEYMATLFNKSISYEVGTLDFHVTAEPDHVKSLLMQVL